MLHLLTGTDRFLVWERKRLVEAEFWHAYPQGEKFVFDIEEEWNDVKQGALSEALSSGGLFATPHLVIVRGCEMLSDEGGAWLIRAVQNLSAEVIAVLVLIPPPKKSKPKWWKSLVTSFPEAEVTALGVAEREQLVRVIFAEAEAKLDASAERYLLEAFPKDMGRLLQEAQRLALSFSGKKITLADIEGSVKLPRESNVFAALDSLVRGDRARAIALFRAEETGADAPFALLGLCAWQVRRLIAVKELAEKEGMLTAAIAKELKTSPYPIQKTLPLLPKLSFLRLRQALERLSDSDQAIKSGRLDPGIALDLFVWKF